MEYREALGILRNRLDDSLTQHAAETDKSDIGEIYKLQEYSEGKQITFVEWAQFGQDQVPFDHIKINVTYDDDDSRKYSFEGFGTKCEKIVEELGK